jgi:hypothetical protein
MKKVLVKVLEDLKETFRADDYIEDDAYEDDYEYEDSHTTHFTGKMIIPDDDDFGVVEVDRFETPNVPTMEDVRSNMKKKKESNVMNIAEVKRERLESREIEELILEVDRLNAEIKSLNNDLTELAAAKNLEIENKSAIITDLKEKILDLKNQKAEEEQQSDAFAIIEVDNKKYNSKISCAAKSLLCEGKCSICDKQCSGDIETNDTLDIRVIDIDAICMLNKQQPKVAFINMDQVKSLVNCESAIVMPDGSCIIFDPYLTSNK